MICKCYYLSQNPDLLICEQKVPLATKLMPQMTWIEVVERLLNIRVGVEVAVRNSELKISVCLGCVRNRWKGFPYMSVDTAASF